jgi:hypothetical protein
MPGRRGAVYVRARSTLVIENSEPNFRKGPEADIQTETLP